MADSVARRPHTATGARGLISRPSPILIDCLPLTVLSSPPRTCLHLLTPSTPILPPTSLSQVFVPNRIYHQPSWSLGDSPFIGSPHFSLCKPPPPPHSLWFPSLFPLPPSLLLYGYVIVSSCSFFLSNTLPSHCCPSAALVLSPCLFCGAEKHVCTEWSTQAFLYPRAYRKKKPQAFCVFFFFKNYKMSDEI